MACLSAGSIGPSVEGLLTARSAWFSVLSAAFSASSSLIRASRTSPSVEGLRESSDKREQLFILQRKDGS
ncbi:MAG: hypothetical protein Q7O66_10290 [Dehalococcoidia bacterium]|nr:hypothetical protein [Dehalococcoidia bacterium]